MKNYLQSAENPSLGSSQESGTLYVLYCYQSVILFGAEFQHEVVMFDYFVNINSRNEFDILDN